MWKRRLKWFRVALLAVVVIGLAGPSGILTPRATAQDGDGDQCTQVIAQALATAQTACESLAPGEFCAGHAGVSATTAGADATSLEISDISALADITSVMTSGLDVTTGDWGVASLAFPAALPEGGSHQVAGVLFGEAQIARPVQVAADRPTVTITNATGSVANLRNGAGVVYEVVGTLEPGQSAVADGRNEQTDWVRIRLEDGTIAWVFVRLIDWEGDLSTLQQLDVLLPTDMTPVFAGGEPFQAFTLTTSPTDTDGCPATSSGLLLQFAGESPARLTVNQVDLAFANATLLLQAAPNNTLEIMTLAGDGVITARGRAADVAAGEAIQVVLGGEDGLTPSTPPQGMRAYAFPEIAAVPVLLLPEEMACMVGVPSAGATVRMRVGPGEQRGELGSMNAALSYVVLGWANDPDGMPWWELDTGEQKAWVAQSAVSAIGGCDAVAQVEPPSMVVAPPSGPAASGGSGGADYAPVANTVWQMQPGTDQMSGECSGAPAINFCDHLAAIAPNAGGISWRGMEPSPYFLSQIQPNVYAYAGPNVLGTGRVNMTLRFDSESTLSMTMILVLNSEPSCQHTYYYTGTRNW